MSRNSKSYPYPVLGNSDDVEGAFNVTYSRTLDNLEISLTCDFSITNSYYMSLIEKRKACFVTQVECPTTFYRNTFNSYDYKLSTVLPAEDLRNTVNLDFYLCASQEIDNYEPDGTHPFLAGFSNIVQTGDVLALGGSHSFVTDKEFDPLKAPVTSFLKIREGSQQQRFMNLDYEDDRVIVYLPPNEHEMYKKIKTEANSKAYIHATIVLPALVEIFYTIKTDNKHAGMTWLTRLEEICNKRGINMSEPLEAAQDVIGKPIARSFEEYISQFDLED